MIVVADTSPLNYLVLIGEIELLEKLFIEVLLPEAVPPPPSTNLEQTNFRISPALGRAFRERNFIS